MQVHFFFGIVRLVRQKRQIYIQHSIFTNFRGLKLNKTKQIKQFESYKIICTKAQQTVAPARKRALTIFLVKQQRHLWRNISSCVRTNSYIFLGMYIGQELYKIIGKTSNSDRVQWIYLFEQRPCNGIMWRWI